MARKKILKRSAVEPARLSREPLFYLEFNKHNKQNVYEITGNSFNKFNFSQSQNNIVDMLTDVGNAKHQ